MVYKKTMDAMFSTTATFTNITEEPDVDFTPSPGHYLVLDRKAETTESGIYLPDSVDQQKHAKRVKIIAHNDCDFCVDGVAHCPIYTTGEEVAISKYAGVQLDKDTLIIRESDILGRFN